jgi:hypothetical protein
MKNGAMGLYTSFPRKSDSGVKQWGRLGGSHVYTFFSFLFAVEIFKRYKYRMHVLLTNKEREVHEHFMI